MTTPGLLILIALVFVLVLIFMELGGLPGRTARERGHPQADAISILGWLGLLGGFIPWLIAMVWARMQPLAIVSDKIQDPASGTEQDLAPETEDEQQAT